MKQSDPVIIYVDGTIVEGDESDIYEPFPTTEESSTDDEE